MTRTTVGLTFFACLFAVVACADPSGPPASGAKTAPRNAAQTRYILASGDVLPPGCTDLGNGLALCDDGGTELQGFAQPAATSGSDDNNNDGN